MASFRGRSRRMSIDRLATTLVSVFVALIVSPLPYAGGNLEVVVNGGTAFLPMSWDDRAIPISWSINAQGVKDNCNNGNPTCVDFFSPLTLERAIAAMTAGFDAWELIPDATLAYDFIGTTSQTMIGLDAIHLMTWADDDPSLCTAGVVAIMLARSTLWSMSAGSEY